MNDDLILQLREISELNSLSRYKRELMAQAADAIEELNGFVQEAERDRDEYRERLDKANDAIEELSKLADAIPHVCECCIGCEVESGGCDNSFVLSPKRAREYMNTPRWIPTTERLPEKRKYVLVRYKNNDMAVACWFDGDEDILFWRAMTDEGWCADCDTDPTHWLQLPEPPKEGNNE